MGKDAERRKTPINWTTYNNQLVEKAKKYAKTEKLLRIKIEIDWEKEVDETNRKKYRTGNKYQFPDSLFVLLYIIKVYHQFSFRELEGYIHSQMNIPVPNFRTIHKRLKHMDYDIIDRINREIVRMKTRNKKIDLVLDSTGVSVNKTHVYREEKYKVKKQREWKKTHLVTDRETGLIINQELLNHDDSEVRSDRLVAFLESVLERIGDNSTVNKLFGDGAYDNTVLFEILKQLNIDSVIKIDKRTINRIKRQLHMNRYKLGNNGRELWKPSSERERKALEQIEWKSFVKNKRYGLRSSIEGLIGSFKNKFGESLISKSFDMMRKELLVRVLIHNIMC